MSSPNNNHKIRKVLFDIFQEMTLNDVEAANFFIRDIADKRCQNIYELMEVLEKLSYFHVSAGKVQAENLIELFGLINRTDLQDKLQRQSKNFCIVNEESNASTVSNGDCGSKRNSESTEEITMMVNNEESNVSAVSNGESESTEEMRVMVNNEESNVSAVSNGESESTEEMRVMESNASAVSNGESESTEEMRVMVNNEESNVSAVSNDESESTEEMRVMVNNEESNVSAVSNGESESTEEMRVMVNNEESNASAVSNRNCGAKRKLFDSKSTKEESLMDFCDPSDNAASNFPENKTVNSTPRHSDSITDLDMSFSSMSLDPYDTPKSTKNQHLESSNSNSDKENTSNATSSQITLYDYQKELADKGERGHNSIICSPTGSGKTITAASVIKHHLDNAKSKQVPYRVLYLVHIRYLVRHLSVDLKKILKDEVYPLEDNEVLSSGVVKSKAVVILTAQILCNALINKSVSLSDYDLLVFDECHNTTLNHPYNEIMTKYHNIKRSQKKVPQILGLSGTLGGGSDPFKAIVSLCANMDTYWVSCVRNEKNKKELSEKNKLPIIDDVIEAEPRPSDEFSKSIVSAMKTFILCLETDYQYKMDFYTLYGTTEFGGYLSTHKTKCELNKLREEGKIFNFLIFLNKALLYYNELTAADAYDYLINGFPEYEYPKLQIEEKIANIYEMTIKNTTDFVLNDKFECNDKLLKLKNLLRSILEDHSGKKVILLCLTRYNAIHLKDRISEDDDLKRFVKADYIIGQSGEDGLTPQQQTNVLKKFEKGDINLLIATSIAEEGLNIPDCEIVIRYMYVTSDISRRQAQGRARKENSQYYLIADKDSEQIYRDYRNKTLEVAMAKALQEITDLGEKKFESKVTEKIEELYTKADEKKKFEENYKYTYQAKDVTILCRECHTVLCKGSDIIKKGSEYICTHPDFQKKVCLIKTREMNYRLDRNIGVSKCKGQNCSVQFGAIKKYFNGERQTGFVLNVKSILFECVGAPALIPLKKWSQHSFPIQEEPLI